MRACLVLAARPETALRTRRIVESRFTLARMAQALAVVYRIASVGRRSRTPSTRDRRVTLLIISPDYASHALPLLAIAEARQRRGHRVVVATGHAVAPLVAAAGMERTTLIMSHGSNSGVIRASEAPPEAAATFAAFITATRDGMLAALRYQAEARATDLLWRPYEVAMGTIRIVEDVRPDSILVDDLAFAATIGLRALGVSYGDVILGHPTALPVGGEVYGVPSSWPVAIAADPMELHSLASSHAAERGLQPSLQRRAALDLTRERRAGQRLRRAWQPRPLQLPRRAPRSRADRAPATACLPRQRGPCRAPPFETAAWLARTDDRPLVVVSLGTFLSARHDVLVRVAARLRRVDVRMAIAIGANDPDLLGAVPPWWLVRASLPQVALLQHAALLVTHGGNNSVTEALTFGVPMLVLPFSTDQFDGAAAVEHHVAGLALDPNDSPRPLIAGSVRGLLRNPPTLPALTAQQLRTRPGPEVAYEAMMLIHEQPRGPARPRWPTGEPAGNVCRAGHAPDASLTANRVGPCRRGRRPPESLGPALAGPARAARQEHAGDGAGRNVGADNAIVGGSTMGEVRRPARRGGGLLGGLGGSLGHPVSQPSGWHRPPEGP